MRIPLALAAALAALATLPACNLTIPLDVTEEYQLVAPAGGAAVAQVIDLTEQDTLWAERDHVEGLEVTRVEVTVVAVGPLNLATRVDLALRLRPEGAPADGSQDVTVATLALSPVAPGQSATAAPAGTAFGTTLLAALHGTGRFTLVLDGDVDDRVDVTFQVRAVGSVDLGVD